MLRPLAQLISRQRRRPYHPYPLLIFCVFTGLMRGILELLLHDTPLGNADFLAFVPFYTLLAMLLSLLLSRFAGLAYTEVQKSLLMGIFLGLFPPLIDFLLRPGAKAFYGYYYLWDLSRLPWLGFMPEFNFPAGECATIWLSILFCALYIAATGGGWLKAIGAAAGAYAIFIFMGSLLPMLVARLTVNITNETAARALDPMQLRGVLTRLMFTQTLLAFGVYLLLEPKILKLVRYRVTHTLPFVALTVLGGLMAEATAVHIAQAALLILICGIALTVQNDHHDAAEDRREKTTTPERYHVMVINWLTVMAIAATHQFESRAAMATLVAYLCGLLYNYPFYRARNIFPANLKIEGIWALSAFLAGALLNPRLAGTPTVLLTAFLVFGGWSLLSMLKDAKDAEDDAANRVRTIFTLLADHGFAHQKTGRILVLTAIVLFLVPSLIVLFLGRSEAAALSGALALLLIAVVLMKPSEKSFNLFLLALTLYLSGWSAIAYLKFL